MSSFLDLYDPLEKIGNGGFGVVRKVKRKADGMVFAWKEINFQTMNEQQRKQMIVEVNILKDLDHGHIVRYIERHTDINAGIHYILMEYCEGGDLSTVITEAAKRNTPIPEDTIWIYFMQLLLALHHCHHPKEPTRMQILHRDLKPANVFLDGNNSVKLGDFGLSKTLEQNGFAKTTVGTPYYMSPELMEGKAYDSKSDIWALGCIIYELCALKPPFLAKTYAELKICIRNRYMAPLPQGYSRALSEVIGSMLHPSMKQPPARPSVAQLCQNERIELAFKLAQTAFMRINARETAVINREHTLSAWETTLQVRDAVLAKKAAEVTARQDQVAQVQRAVEQEVEKAVRAAVTKKKEELRAAVEQREKAVQAAVAKRESAVAENVQKREQEAREAWAQAWAKREAEITREVKIRIRNLEQRMDSVKKKEAELKAEELQLSKVRKELEDKMAEWDLSAKARKEVNLPIPSARVSRKAAKDRGPDARPSGSDISSSGSSPTSGPSNAQPATSLKPFMKGASGRTPVSGPAKKTRPAKLEQRSRSDMVDAVPAAVKPRQLLGSVSACVPQYDFEDEDNLPSPFLKRAELNEAHTDNEEESSSSVFKWAEHRQTVTTARATAVVAGAKASATGGSGKRPVMNRQKSCIHITRA